MHFLRKADSTSGIFCVVLKRKRGCGLEWHNQRVTISVSSLHVSTFLSILRMVTSVRNIIFFLEESNRNFSTYLVIYRKTYGYSTKVDGSGGVICFLAHIDLDVKIGVDAVGQFL